MQSEAADWEPHTTSSRQDGQSLAVVGGFVQLLYRRLGDSNEPGMVAMRAI